MRLLACLLSIAFATDVSADWKVPSSGEFGPAATSPIARTVDLGEPGALEALEQSNPERYRKVVQIMRIAGDVSCETLPQMLKVQHDVAAARCSSALVLTSYPAKRHLWFQLEDTAYVANVVLHGARGKLYPAK